MEVVDLTKENEKLYFMCLEDWSEEMKEAGKHKEHWYSKMREKGLRVKLARDDRGIIGGMVQFGPIEHSFAEGLGLYFIYCIWVHGHKEGRGNFQGRGMGKALLSAAEADARAMGAEGMASWGVSLPFFMRAAWFSKQGYRKVDKQGVQVLLWKPFKVEANPPKWIIQRKKPELIPGKVVVNAFRNGWCPAMNMVFERARRAASEFGRKVVFNEYDTFRRETFLEWGIADGIFVNGRKIRTGPPPSYEKIRRMIEKSVRKLKGGRR